MSAGGENLVDYYVHLQEDSILYSSPSLEDPEQLPMSSLLTSIHARMEGETEEERRSRDVPQVKQSKSLIKTRRLLYWAYQVRIGTGVVDGEDGCANVGMDVVKCLV